MKTKGELIQTIIKECDTCNLDFHQHVQSCPLCDNDLIEVTTVTPK